ncbi:MAG TPA: zinc ribbon domain-containing protein [Dongiaceae bacterium]|nr:zinc ribbon domain-containing protein [Dongiaceae bacterium]
MAFCNSCGATLTGGTKFCSKCGAPVSGVSAAAPPPAAPAPPPSTGSSSALKIILIVVGVVVLIGIIGVASLSFFAYRIAKHSRVSQKGDSVKVETPFGTVESSKDPEQAAKDLGIDIYPGAVVQKNGSASATFGNIKTVTAFFESDDSADKVCTFYQQKLPGANVNTSDSGHCTLVANMPPNMITINVDSRGGGSRFQVTSVNKKPASDQ